jgi:E3 ubiquitin-protein ligase HUWE1
MHHPHINLFIYYQGPLHHDFTGVPPIIQQLQDLERGITHLNQLSMLEGMSDPPGYDSPDFRVAMDDGLRGALSREFDDGGEMDEGEDDYLEDYDEDIVYEPEGDDGAFADLTYLSLMLTHLTDEDIEMPEGTIGIRTAGDLPMPMIEYAHRHGHHHHHHQAPGYHVHHRLGHVHPSGSRPRQDDGSNPLLQRHGPSIPSPHRHDHGVPEAIIGGFEQFIDGTRPFPVAGDAPHHQMSFINNIMNLITHGGGAHMLPSPNGHAVRVQISSNDGSMLVRQRMNRHGIPQPSSAPRDDPILASQFNVSATSNRWQEEARILFGSSVAEKASNLVNALHLLLVPAARRAQAEEEIRQKRLEEEAKEKERKAREEREAKEKMEREEAEKKAQEQRAIEEAANAAAEAELAVQRENLAREAEARRAAGIVDEPEIEEDRMSGVETTQAEDALQVEEVPAASAPHVPIMRTLEGREVDIAALGIDPDYFDAIPPDMQAEIFMVQAVTQRAEAEVSGAEATEFDAEFLAALPEEMREEIIATSRQERRRREREAERRRAAASGPIGGTAQAEEMDIPSFLASLENGDLRRSILMDADEDVLRQLPADLVAEARQYSRFHSRPGRDALLGVHGEVYPPSGMARPEQVSRPRRPHQYVQILDKASVATLLRLLFLQQNGSLKQSFNEILGSICHNKQNRAEVVSIILQILQDTGNDLSMDKTLAHLLSRAKQGVGIKTPQPKRSSTDALQHTELSPAMVAKNCLDTLSQLSMNHKVIEFFLTEHETNSAFKPKTSRKGKAKDTKANRYPINALLGLLDRKLITENASLMENLAVLLQALAAPLAALAKKKQEEEQEKKDKEAKADAAQSSNQESSIDAITQALIVPKIESESATGTEQGTSAEPLANAAEAGSSVAAPVADPAAEAKKPRGITEPPEITDFNLRLVINIIAARECSSRAFQKTLTLITHLSSAIPNAMNIFGQELIRQAQDLGRNILQDLRDLFAQINKATTGHEVQGVAIAKFSPASSDQTKLLRVITALGYIFNSKRTFAVAADDQSADNDKILLSLYENDTFGPLWETLSSCLTAIHERGNMMNVATILLPLIEVLMVVCQNPNQQDSSAVVLASSQKENTMSSPAPESPPSNMGSLFFKFTDDHKKILNELVRNNPKLMSGSFQVLVKNSKVLEFDNKRNYFQRKLHAKESQPNGHRPSYPSLQINVRRDSTFLDSFRSLSFKKPDEFKFGKLNVRFQGEEGVDAGGLTREWFQVLVQQIFNPNYALFNPMASDRLTYHPNPLSGINDVHLSYFSFVGRVIGKAMYESRPLDCHFSRAVYKRMLGQLVGVKDMEAHDPSYYGSLKYILENKLSDGFIGDFTFSAETEEFGEMKVEDLIENGRNIPVTDENKREYVRLTVEHKLVTSIKDQLDHFLKGMFASLSPLLQCHTLYAMLT